MLYFCICNNLNKLQKMNTDYILTLLKQGLTNVEIAKIVKTNIDNISKIRSQYYLPNAKIINKLNKNLDFKDYFINIFYNNTNEKCLQILQKSEMFKRIKINKHLISSLRYFYGIVPKMYENTYISNQDRIKGYMIRNSKYTSKRRNIKLK